MIIGIFLLIAGILLVLYPPLLSIVVASLFMFGGITLMSISYRYKKLRKHVDDPFVDFFIRF